MSFEPELRFDEDERQVQAWHDGAMVGWTSVPDIAFHWGEGLFVPMAGIAGVGTDEAFRGRGIASRMMGRAIAFAKSEGYPVGGVSTNYNNVARRLYTRNGYVFVFSVDNWSKTPLAPRAHERPQGIVVRRCEPRDDAQVVALFERTYRGYFGNLRQTPERWRAHRAPTLAEYPEALLVAEEDGRVVGYIDVLLHWGRRLRGTLLVAEEHPRAEAIQDVLLAQLETHFTKQSVKTLYFDATHHQTGLRAALGRSGYRPTGRFVFHVAIFDLPKLLAHLRPLFSKRIAQSDLVGFPSALTVRIDDTGAAAEVPIDAGTSSTLNISGSYETVTRLLCGRVGAWQAYLRGHLKISGWGDQTKREQLNALLGRTRWFHPMVDRW